MAGEVLYTRVAPELKEAADAHAVARGVTLTAAVAELLGVGLEAVHNGRSIRTLSERVAALEQQLALETLRREQAEQRYQAMQAAGTSLSQRAARQLGKCGKCEAPIVGTDILILGACPKCGEPLSIQPKASSGLDEREFLLLAGAVGVVVGMLIARK